MLDLLFDLPFSPSKTEVGVFVEAAKVLQVSSWFDTKSSKFPSSSDFSVIRFSTFGASGRLSLILFVFSFFCLESVHVLQSFSFFYSLTFSWTALSSFHSNMMIPFFSKASLLGFFDLVGFFSFTLFLGNIFIFTML